MSEASQITRRARSNLAFALRVLPAERRGDAVVFYAFCRTLDDLADEPGLPVETRRALLNNWKQGLQLGFADPDALQGELLVMMKRQQIPVELLLAIVDGCLMDLEPQRYPDWEALDGYIWKVACAVGLVSIRIFGCQHPDSEAYAVALGRALQLTNILRDVGEDWANQQRIYLPIEVMEQFGCNEETLRRNGQDHGFLPMMHHVAERAERAYLEAQKQVPAVDHRALAPARIMAGVYQQLLHEMKADNFRVFEKRYRVSKFRKFRIMAGCLLERQSAVSQNSNPDSH